MGTTRNGVTDTALLSLALSTRVMAGGAPEIVMAEMSRVDAELVTAIKQRRITGSRAVKRSRRRQ